MFASVGTVDSRYGQSAFLKGYAPQKGFSIRALKGSSLSSFPQPTTTKFDPGYRPILLAEPLQNQNWYPSRSQNTSKSYTAPSEPSKTSRSQTSDNTTTITSRGTNARSTTPGYSIYQSSNDTYVYEPSLSSKSDLHSNSEYDGDSTTTFSPSSFFSPAMSTDSLTTFKSPMTQDTSLPGCDSRSSTPTPLRNASASHVTGLAQAHSAIRGIFRSQPPHETQPSLSDAPFIPHAPSTRPTPLPRQEGDAHFRDGVTSQGRSTAPIRLSSVSSGSGDWNTAHSATLYSNPTSIENTSLYAPSTISESEHIELDRVARANAEYNAASSVSSSTYYPSRRDSVLVSASNNIDGAPRQIYPNLPLRSSPEQQYALPVGGTPYIVDSIRETPPRFATGDTSSNYTDSRSAPSHRLPSSNLDDTTSSQPSQYVHPLSEWMNETESREVPVRHQSEERPSSQIPRFLNEGPPQNRYVPSSRTVAPNSTSTAARMEHNNHQDRPLPVPPATGQSQRERKASISPRAPAFPHNLRDNTSTLARGRDGEVSRRGSTDQHPIPSVPHTAGGPNLALARDPAEPLQASDRSSNSSPSRKTSPEQYHAVPPRRDQPLASTGGGISNTSNYPSARTFPVQGISPEQEQRHPSAIYTGWNSDRSAGQNYITSGNIGPNTLNPSLSRTSQTLKTFPTQDQRSVPTNSAQNSIDPRLASNTTASVLAQSRSQQVLQPDTRNSLTRNQHTRHGNREHQSGANENNIDRSKNIVNGVASRYTQPGSNEVVPQPIYPVHPPPPPATSSTLQRPLSSNRAVPERSRVNSDQRPFDFTANQRPFAPPSVCSDPGQGGNDYRRAVNQEPYRVQEVSEERILSQPILTNDVSRSRVLFSNARPQHPEPQRRHSDGEMPVNNSHPYGQSHPPFSTVAPTETHRRFSDGDQANAAERNTLTLFRTVRWNDNLVCPSPISSSQRRKGWFNRRGDQLWTNEGAYKPPPAGEEYPPDLDGYPEHGDGWMNEDCVRIDMGHRLVPKAPLKSALKQPRAQNAPGK